MMIEGQKLLNEALHAGHRIHAVLVDEERSSDYAALIGRIKEMRFAPDAARHGINRNADTLRSGLASTPGVSVYTVTERVLRALSDTKTPQGIVAAIGIPAPLDLDTLEAVAAAGSGLLVALDGVRDPGNVGAIWRTADAVGAVGLLLSGDCADQFSPKVVRASMGALFRVPTLRCDELAGELRGLGAAGYEVLVSALCGEDFFTYRASGAARVLVIGGEARGVSEAVVDAAARVLTLPMRGGAESLNAAVAAGIMMYHLSRGEH